eukprot:GHVT01048938.1.p1 GENE.GHVT01048938.1~~GHVT01048938.1.p1  ORF type:complete len:536 (+),score=139.98 GHVT01048938.1:845-2452(+)
MARFIFEAFKALQLGCSLLCLHGRQSATKRVEVFREFGEREKAVSLISTDLASRGADFPNVHWVVQYDRPDCVATYIHRVGRTARLFSSGKGLLLLSHGEEEFLHELLQAKINIQRTRVNSKRAVNIHRKLTSILAANVELKVLAQRALVSYVRSVSILPGGLDRVRRLPLPDLAKGMGLSAAPTVRVHQPPPPSSSSSSSSSSSLVPGAAPGGLGSTTEETPRQKNCSKLDRFKEKIRQKKLLKRQKSESQAASPGAVACESLGVGPGPSTPEDDDDFLKEVTTGEAAAEAAAAAEPSEELAEWKPLAGREQFKHSRRLAPTPIDVPACLKHRLKLSAEGPARIRGLGPVATLAAVPGAAPHQFFDDEEDARHAAEEAAEEAGGGEGAEGTLWRKHQSYVDRLRSRMEGAQEPAKHRDRERVQEKHRRSRLKKRKLISGLASAAGGDDAGVQEIQLMAGEEGGGSDASDGAAGVHTARRTRAVRTPAGRRQSQQTARPDEASRHTGGRPAEAGKEANELELLESALLKKTKKFA